MRKFSNRIFILKRLVKINYNLTGLIIHNGCVMYAMHSQVGWFYLYFLNVLFGGGVAFARRHVFDRSKSNKLHGQKSNNICRLSGQKKAGECRLMSWQHPPGRRCPYCYWEETFPARGNPSRCCGRVNRCDRRAGQSGRFRESVARVGDLACGRGCENHDCECEAPNIHSGFSLTRGRYRPGRFRLRVYSGLCHVPARVESIFNFRLYYTLG